MPDLQLQQQMSEFRRRRTLPDSVDAAGFTPAADLDFEPAAVARRSRHLVE
jgi:hypothetical protein